MVLEKLKTHRREGTCWPGATQEGILGEVSSEVLYSFNTLGRTPRHLGTQDGPFRMKEFRKLSSFLLKMIKRQLFVLFPDS